MTRARLQALEVPLGITVAVMIVAIAVAIAGYQLSEALGASGSEFLVGYLATVAGAVVGIPIGLTLSRVQERDAQAGVTRARLQRQVELMANLRSDLEDVQLELQARQPRELVIAPFLGSGLWRTLQTSGALELIDDRRTLREISRAYDRISLTAYLERELWEAWHAPDRWARMYDPPDQPSVRGRQALLTELLSSLADQDDKTQASIEVALSLIPPTQDNASVGGG